MRRTMGRWRTAALPLQMSVQFVTKHDLYPPPHLPPPPPQLPTCMHTLIPCITHVCTTVCVNYNLLCICSVLFKLCIYSASYYCLKSRWTNLVRLTLIRNLPVPQPALLTLKGNCSGYRGHLCVSDPPLSPYQLYL